MLEEIAAEIEHHVLVELCVDIVAQDGESVVEQSENDPSHDSGDQKAHPVGGEKAEHRIQRWWRGLVAEDVVYKNFERPWQEQRDSGRQHHHHKRGNAQSPVWLEIQQDAGYIPHASEPLAQRDTARRIAAVATAQPSNAYMDRLKARMPRTPPAIGAPFVSAPAVRPART